MPPIRGFAVTTNLGGRPGSGPELAGGDIRITSGLGMLWDIQNIGWSLSDASDWFPLSVTTFHCSSSDLRSFPNFEIWSRHSCSLQDNL